MRTFKEVKSINEEKFGNPLYTEKDHLKNLLVSACGNDQRVLNDIVDSLTLEQMKKCFNEVSKKYTYTGDTGKDIKPSV